MSHLSADESLDSCAEELAGTKTRRQQKKKIGGFGAEDGGGRPQDEGRRLSRAWGWGAGRASGGRWPMGLAGSDSDLECNGKKPPGTVKRRGTWFSVYTEATPLATVRKQVGRESKAWRPARGRGCGGGWGG